MTFRNITTTTKIYSLMPRAFRLGHKKRKILSKKWSSDSARTIQNAVIVKKGIAQSKIVSAGSTCFVHSKRSEPVRN